MKEKLELRMYGLVPYNISEIQKGIQFGHAVVEYGQNVKKVGGEVSDIYDDWANNWKTFIILNGGTSNHIGNRYNDDLSLGSMENNLEILKGAGVTTAEFYEPDLNDMLSSIVFVVDERVFNNKDYPNFEDWVIENYEGLLKPDPNNWKTIGASTYKLAKLLRESDAPRDKKIYNKWVNFIGGERNVFLKEFLSPKNFKLA